jgi:hypothetical protein
LFHGGSLPFWTAFSVGHDLAALRATIPDVLRARLLNVNEFRGAALELSAAAHLARGGVRFDWFPQEGGEFRVHDDELRYIEAKRPQYESDGARAEMTLINDVGRALQDAAPGLAVAYALRPELAEEMPRSQRRQLTVESFAPRFIKAIRQMIETGDVPGRRALPIGTVWLARTQEEMRELRAGGYGGLYLDNEHEAGRVVRSVINRAIRQLPGGQPSLIFLDWGAATAEFGKTVERRLSSLTKSDPAIAAVLIRTARFTPRDVVPEESAWLIENPALPGLAARSAAVEALRTDHLHDLRDGPAEHAESGS